MEKDWNKHIFTCLGHQESIARDNESCCKTLRVEGLYLEYLVVRIFLYSDWIRSITENKEQNRDSESGHFSCSESGRLYDKQKTISAKGSFI